ncbi:hypothetical protein A6E15_19165 [Natrinema saccharevitans]|uniref:Winged helix-turn-helix domain-containing protein n=1 Tax=Natrinema saccharevitans TaxID=301967 RepID=A0A1S8AQT1_9EURY|nr:winged helix-turn-helix domain-containing protein [Natrinema saccharevitans]OLZ39085.1 hypothetical protein A6E15_19165 [Natrinema saccharevitans]
MPKGKSEKTDLQRDILVTWYQNPDATNQEIADACNCSASYVSQITNRFDDYSHMEAMIDQQDREMERMFGDDIFQGMPPAGGGVGASAQAGPGLADIYSEQPDNLVGYIVRALIVLILLYITYEIAMVLVL